jgi:2-methylisocitrate lyase-like PEP mutase family enzyme
MTSSNTRQLAEQLRSMHRGDMLVLPNAWDALSARIFQEAGCRAVATTSAGVSWSLGYPDGERVPWDEFVGATRRIARAVSVPVTVDFEGGFSQTDAQLAERVREIIGVGASGINLEDSSGASHSLRPLDVAAKRIAAARESGEREGVPIVINGRTDAYLQAAFGGQPVSFPDVLQRCRAYVAAGADCVYPIGLADLSAIAQLVKELGAPVNIMGRPGSPSLQELRAAGVARVSAATSFALQVAGVLLDSIVKVKETGSFEHCASPFSYPRMQALFDRAH